MRRLSAYMPTPRAPKVVSRYDLVKITAEINHQRRRLGWEIKDLAWAADFGDTIDRARDNWYKAQGRHSWSVEQLGRLAAVLAAPPNWPFAEWTVDLQRAFPGTRPR